MTKYTLDVNGKRYSLSEEFRESLQERARREYKENDNFSCWWSIASKDNYSEEEWDENIHEEGDPILTIETRGVMVPWDDMDQLGADMPGDVSTGYQPETEGEDINEGGGMATKPPEKPHNDKKDIFGRTHFSLTPHHFEELPQPEGDDPEKIPPKPTKVDDNAQLVMWLPRHPEIEHTWGAGEAITPVSSWVEWNVQQRANQPRPDKEKRNSHDSFESLCRIHDCEQVGEYTPSNDIPQGESGQVERKGEEAYEDGRFGGGNWNV